MEKRYFSQSRPLLAACVDRPRILKSILFKRILNTNDTYEGPWDFWDSPWTNLWINFWKDLQDNLLDNLLDNPIVQFISDSDGTTCVLSERQQQRVPMAGAEAAFLTPNIICHHRPALRPTTVAFFLILMSVFGTYFFVFQISRQCRMKYLIRT